MPSSVAFLVGALLLVCLTRNWLDLPVMMFSPIKVPGSCHDSVLKYNKYKWLLLVQNNGPERAISLVNERQEEITMGIFTRMRDIVNSNLNNMLEKAEDPEKLIKLMIMEMEDTLVEIKSNAAGVIAAKKKVERELFGGQARAGDWENKAQLAVDKGRDDLAREALAEKRFYLKKVEELDRERGEFDTLSEQYKDDIRQLESKLAEAREKHRILVQRSIRANGSKKVQTQIRKAESNDAFVRFEQLESRIERSEIEADLVNFGRKSSLEDQFAALEQDEEIERELQLLHRKKTRSEAASESK
jgi:phage shock protein A